MRSFRWHKFSWIKLNPQYLPSIYHLENMTWIHRDRDMRWILNWSWNNAWSSRLYQWRCYSPVQSENSSTQKNQRYFGFFFMGGLQQLFLIGVSSRSVEGWKGIVTASWWIWKQRPCLATLIAARGSTLTAHAPVCSWGCLCDPVPSVFGICEHYRRYQMNLCDMDIFVAKEIFATRQQLQKHPVSDHEACWYWSTQISLFYLEMDGKYSVPMMTLNGHPETT